MRSIKRSAQVRFQSVSHVDTARNSSRNFRKSPRQALSKAPARSSSIVAEYWSWILDPAFFAPRQASCSGAWSKRQPYQRTPFPSSLITVRQPRSMFGQFQNYVWSARYFPFCMESSTRRKTSRSFIYWGADTHRLASAVRQLSYGRKDCDYYLLRIWSRSFQVTGLDFLANFANPPGPSK